MMKLTSLALLPLIALAACSPFKNETPPMRILAGNIEGVVVQYDGPQAMLREADILARTHCERYGRPAVLLNELPGEGDTIAYYYCQG